MQSVGRNVGWFIAQVVILGLVTVPSAFAQITVTGSLLVEQSAAPGDSYRGEITVRNPTNTTQTVTLTLADYRFNANGSSSFGAPASHSHSNTSWITLSQQAVSIAPQETQVVGYTVSVPSGAASVDGTYVLGVPGGPAPSAGSYWSVVLVEGEDRTSAPSASSTFTVTPKIRFAVQLVTHVGNTGECRLVFGNPTLHPGTMAVDVSGQGPRSFRPNLKLEVYDSDGAIKHTATKRGSYLYPETSARQTFDLPPLAPGMYSFVILADVGGDKLQGARFQVQVR
jgi:hypothetical protein